MLPLTVRGNTGYLCPYSTQQQALNTVPIFAGPLPSPTKGFRAGHVGAPTIFSQITGHQHCLNDEHHHGQHDDHQLQELGPYAFSVLKLDQPSLFKIHFLKWESRSACAALRLTKKKRCKSRIPYFYYYIHHNANTTCFGRLSRPVSGLDNFTHTHTHTHIYIYIYILYIYSYLLIKTIMIKVECVSRS